MKTTEIYMANDWAESVPFEKIACEKAKNIS